MDWTKWFGIDVISEHKGPAVYKVRLVNNKGKCFQLLRLLRTDEAGIMCIGQTGNMEQRRTQFLTAIRGAKNHSSMNLVYYLKTYSNFLNIFKDAKFQYSFRRCSSINESKNCESALIKLYFKEFGEVPPLTSSMPKRHEGWEP